MAKLNDASALYLGAAAALKAMLGATQVWSPLPSGLVVGAYAKGASASGNSATTAAMTTQSAGSGLVAAVVTKFYGASDGIVLTDSKGNVFTLVDSQRETSGNVYLSMYYCANAIGGAGHTVMATRSSSGPTIMVAELKSGSGIELVGYDFADGAASPYLCGSVVTSDPAVTLVGVLAGYKASGAVAFSPSSGETILASNTAAQYGALGTKAAPSPGTQDFSLGLSPTPFTGIGANLAFKKAAP